MQNRVSAVPRGTARQNATPTSSSEYRRISPAFLVAPSLALLATAVPSLLRAQATPAGSVPGHFQVGGGYTRANPDYSPENFNGFTAYGDFDFFKYVGVEAAFHRIAGSGSITETTYAAGGRVRYPIARLEPYLRLVAGAGTFNFQQSTQNGTYKIFAGGGGLDYRLTGRVILRADYEYQRWGSFPPTGLQPNLFTLGAAYRFR